MDAIGPTEEVCNRKDDDCNGVVDDIDGEESIEMTACACYGDALPMIKEVCNDVDDDCDGEIDDGIRCCQDGERRECGKDKGICEKGEEICIDGRWSGDCKGGILPQEEICYDGLDNDCDGVADPSKYCNPDVTCNNGIKDLNEMDVDCGGNCVPCDDYTTWMVFSIIIVIMIGAAGVLELTGKI
jgi:hypothetical protein